jgi:nitroreductase
LLPLLVLQSPGVSFGNLQDKLSSQKKLHRIVESGRFAPTACNFQTFRFIVVQENYQKLRAILLKQLNADGEEILKSSNDVVLLDRASGWINQWKTYQKPLLQKTLFL